MKQQILMALAVLTATSASADPIGLEIAEQTARTIAGENSNVVLVKKASRTLALSKRLASATERTAPYYVFSKGKNQGFVIVSGDDCLPTILGYTEHGDFDEASLPPSLLAWLDYYAEIVERAQVAGENVSRNSANRAAAKAVTAAKQDVPVLMSTHWHQTWPYNSYCPFLTAKPTQRAVTGCVATAGAQVVYYFHKDNPSTLGASTPTYGYGDAPVTQSVKKGTPMKWDLMLNDYNSAHPAEFDDAVGEFTFALGAATWMTYGESSGAHINNLVGTFNSLFNLSSEHLYKSETSSQADWENRIYGDLAEGRPMVYAGYHVTKKDNGEEQWDGHAVVVDGYRASGNLFHFNFGWGGQGDGWYTVDDNTGMNGFNTGMEITYRVQPRKPNLSASMSFPAGFYAYRENPIKIKITNNGTLPYSGLYAFCTTTSSVKSLSTAKAKDLTTVIPVDGSEVTLVLSAKPTSEKAWYVTLTDKNLNVLAQQKLMAEEGKNELICHGLSVYASNETVATEGQRYSVVNGNKLIVKADVTNNSDYAYEDNPRLDIYGSADEGKTFELVGTKYGISASVPAKARGDVEFSISNTSSCPIECGHYYYAALRNPLSAKSDIGMNYESEDTLVRFYVRESEGLTSTLDGKVLRFSGDWNASQFLSQASLSSNVQALNYDLTGVNGVGNVPQVENHPNALYYVASDCNDIGSLNVVRAGKAKRLAIKAGYEFVPKTALDVDYVSFDVAIEPNRWSLLTVPFDADVPNGMVAKEILSHTNYGITNKTEVVSRFSAGHTYLVMTSSSASQIISAGPTSVLNAPVSNVDTALIGTFTSQEAPVGACFIDDAETQMFQVADDGFQVEPFRGYFYDAKVTKAFKANSNAVQDPGYLKLGETIAAARQIMDEYAETSSDSARQVLADSIAQAETVFTTRPFKLGREATSLAQTLDAVSAAYKIAYAQELSHPVDMTFYIENPSFELSQQSSSTGSLLGWTRESGKVSVSNVSLVANRSVGAEGKYVAYSCHASDSTGSELSQTISGLRAGLYRLSAQVGTSIGRHVTLFAGERDTTVGCADFGKYYLREAVVDSIVVTSGQDLTIGIKAGDWYKADDFRLTYVRSLLPQEDPVGITSVSTEKSDRVRVAATEGGIRISTQETRVVNVYAITGTLVATVQVGSPIFVPLQRGLYLVEGKKVYVK